MYVFFLGVILWLWSQTHVNQIDTRFSEVRKREFLGFRDSENVFCVRKTLWRRRVPRRGSSFSSFDRLKGGLRLQDGAGPQSSERLHPATVICSALYFDRFVDHGISFQPSVNQPPSGLSVSMREDRVIFCRGFEPSAFCKMHPSRLRRAQLAGWTLVDQDGGGLVL